MHHANTIQNKARMAVLYKVDIRAKNISRNKEGNFIMTKK